MNSIGCTCTLRRYCLVLICLSVVCWLCFSVDVWAAAAESVVSFRSRYDVAMKWVNFIIMVAIFFKYGYGPLLRFIQSQRMGIEKKIDNLEEKRKIVASELENAIRINERNEGQLKKLRRRIVSEGEEKYQTIIEQARQQSKVMLEDAKRKTEVQIIEARNAVKNEIVDTAIKLAEEKLKTLTSNNCDNDDILDAYTESIVSGKKPDDYTSIHILPPSSFGDKLPSV